ncbi:E4 [Canis familiaris papillomavirus 8]|uniref:E4 n=1 Tax=Canis familiaris papillomavirus 8 TaxID=1081055 RepID=G3DRE1_9PAPI|nr:E4 [Canis familiaris papillomavirus 8]AEO16194.1 E4 [Canis familiaris papillomavirus 8]
MQRDIVLREYGRLCITMRPFHLAILLLALHRPPTLVERLNYILTGYPPPNDEPETGERSPARGRRRRRKERLSSPQFTPPHTPPRSPTALLTPPSPFPSLLGGFSDPPSSQWELPPSQRRLAQGRSRGPTPPKHPESQRSDSPHPPQQGPGPSASQRIVSLPRGVPRSPRTNPFWFPFTESVEEEGTGLSVVRGGGNNTPGPLRSRPQTPDHWDPLPRPEEVPRRRRRPRLQQQHEDLRLALQQLGRDAFQLREDIETDLNTFFGKLGIAPHRL